MKNLQWALNMPLCFFDKVPRKPRNSYPSLQKHGPNPPPPPGGEIQGTDPRPICSPLPPSPPLFFDPCRITKVVTTALKDWEERSQWGQAGAIQGENRFFLAWK